MLRKMKNKYGDVKNIDAIIRQESIKRPTGSQSVLEAKVDYSRAKTAKEKNF